MLKSSRRTRRIPRKTNRKRVYRSTKLSVSKAVKAYVKGMISRQEETKEAMPTTANNVEIQPYGIANTHGSTHFSFTPMFQTITQGNQNGQRVGDVIKVQKLLLQGFINFDPSHYGDTSYMKNPLYVKLIVYRRKDSVIDPCNYTAPSGSSSSTTGISDLLMNGSTSTSPQNLPTDMYRKFNTDVYKIYTTRLFKLGNSSPSDSPNETGQYNNDFSLSRRFSINLSKHVDKVKFNQSGGAPTNCAFHVAFLVCFANGYTPSNGQKPCVEIHYDMNCTYKDA